ncbi:MAG: (d)CMP kinase [Pseudolabrys sp.]|nr:(d)CMP kinase [Pseudolabrys sp.]MBV9260645.1 (d)CMP kinase [Pseudolabrys sp.]
MIIAIDGPAASGKGTLGSRLAQHYGLRHLDTGLLYRAVAKAVLDAGKPPQDKATAVVAARALDHAHLDRHVLQADAIGTAASIVSAFPEVRAVLVEYQRSFAAKPPGAVLDGRDIGTVIAPNADVKIFLVASAEERARRRTKDVEKRGERADFERILADIRTRDDRDTNRPISPLKPAPDAHLLDTTQLDIDAVIRAAIDIVEATRTGRGRG